MNLLVNIIGLGLIGAIYWFFLMRRESKAVAEEEILITVDGGYKPELITVKKGQTVKLKFLRHDPSSCLEEVILPEFKIKRFLVLNQTTEVIIRPNKVGDFRFSCGMNMYHGTLHVME